MLATCYAMSHPQSIEMGDIFFLVIFGDFILKDFLFERCLLSAFRFFRVVETQQPGGCEAGGVAGHQA